MLIRFEVSNFRSIAAAAELSLVAVDRDRPAAREAELLKESVLTRAAIYGPNASGKSNVLAALLWLSRAVKLSLRDWGDRIPVDPFAFEEWRDKPAEFAVDYLVDGVRYEYLLGVSRDQIHHEALYHYPKGPRSRMIFERDGEEVKFGSSLGSVPPIDELLTPTTLVLSLARRFQLHVAAKFAWSLEAIDALGNLPGVGERMTFDRTTVYFDRDSEVHAFVEDERDQVLGLLRLADLGISDVIVEHDEPPAPVNRDGAPLRTPPRAYSGKDTISFVHDHGNDPVAFEIDDESQGTRAWYWMIGPIVNTLRNGNVLIIDELDASLHPLLSAELLKIFADESTNPHGAQLIFSTHDTSLLSHLNRDEVWFTEKRLDGSTVLGALAEFAGEQVRKGRNLESAYLAGRFGGIPDVDELDFLRSLGLVG